MNRPETEREQVETQVMQYMNNYKKKKPTPNGSAIRSIVKLFDQRFKGSKKCMGKGTKKVGFQENGSPARRCSADAISGY